MLEPLEDQVNIYKRAITSIQSENNRLEAALVASRRNKSAIEVYVSSTVY